MDRMSSNRGNNNWRRRPSRRKSYARRIPKDTLINVAEARREIVYALHLHRSSSSSSSSCTTGYNFIRGSMHDHNHHHQPEPQQLKQYLSYSVMESLPIIPEPTWSTTAPSTCASPSYNGALEPELDESTTSSYTWWLGFLQDIDSKSNQHIVIPLPFEAASNDQVMHNSMVYKNSVESSELSCVHDPWDACNYSLLVDQWLVNPAAEGSQSEVINGKDL